MIVAYVQRSLQLTANVKEGNLPILPRLCAIYLGAVLCCHQMQQSRVYPSDFEVTMLVTKCHATS